MSTVIIGTGIIGASTAYYLSQSEPATSIHLIESSPELFASASGYAGGFLAKDWHAPAAAALGELSFAEHIRLAAENNGQEKWGYNICMTSTYSPSKTGPEEGKRDKDWLDWLFNGTSRANTAKKVVSDVSNDDKRHEPKWFNKGNGKLELIADDGSTAGVNPKKLAQWFLDQAVDKGVIFHHPAKAVSVKKDAGGQLQSVRIVASKTGQEVEVPCKRILIAAGSWSPQVFKTLFPDSKLDIPITSLAGHSLIVRSSRWTKADEEVGFHAVYTSLDGFSPEIYGRMGEELYVAGLNSSTIPLPDLATESILEEASIAKLQQVSQTLLGIDNVDDLEVLRKGLCFRPVTDTGTPILSRIADEKMGVKTEGGGIGGVFLAAGHGPWGISLGPGTGKVMAEMMQGLTTSADISELGL